MWMNGNNVFKKAFSFKKLGPQKVVKLIHRVLLSFTQFLPKTTSYIAIVQYQTRKLTIVQYCSVDCKFCSVFMFLHVSIGMCVHMYVYCSMQFSPCTDFCNSYHNQNTKLFQQHKRTPLCCPFISHTTSTPPPDNH